VAEQEQPADARCRNCKHWLLGVTPNSGGYGYCLHADVNRDPRYINGTYYEGGAGLETYGGAVCPEWQRKAPKRPEPKIDPRP
jgi:hypothetical protein